MAIRRCKLRRSTEQTTGLGYRVRVKTKTKIEEWALKHKISQAEVIERLVDGTLIETANYRNAPRNGTLCILYPVGDASLFEHRIGGMDVLGSIRDSVENVLAELVSDLPEDK